MRRPPRQEADLEVVEGRESSQDGQGGCGVVIRGELFGEGLREEDQVRRCEVKDIDTECVRGLSFDPGACCLTDAHTVDGQAWHDLPRTNDVWEIAYNWS